MKRLLASLISGTFAFALLAAPADAARITDLDRPINLTARVLSGTIAADIERIYPEVGPNGTKYNALTIAKARADNLAAHQEHCKTHQSFRGLTRAARGRGIVRGN